MSWLISVFWPIAALFTPLVCLVCMLWISVKMCCNLISCCLLMWWVSRPYTVYHCKKCNFPCFLKTSSINLKVLSLITVTVYSHIQSVQTHLLSFHIFILKSQFFIWHSTSYSCSCWSHFVQKGSKKTTSRAVLNDESTGEGI